MPDNIEQEISEIAETLNTSDLAHFAENLLTARSVWREHRELVEAEGFPEYLRGPYMEEYEVEPEHQDVDYGRPFLTIEQIEGNRQMAEEAVKRRAA